MSIHLEGEGYSFYGKNIGLPKTVKHLIWLWIGVAHGKLFYCLTITLAVSPSSLTIGLTKTHSYIHVLLSIVNLKHLIMFCT